MNRPKSAEAYYGISVAVYAGILIAANIIEQILQIIFFPIVVLVGFVLHPAYVFLTYIVLAVALFIIVYQSKNMWVFPLACLTVEFLHTLFAAFVSSGSFDENFIDGFKQLLLIFLGALAISAAEHLILSKQDEISLFVENIKNKIINTIFNGGKRK